MDSNVGLWTILGACFILATSHSMSPDHCFPFVMFGKAHQYRRSKVLALASLAGIGHVGTSVIIGLIGVFAKTGTSKDIAFFWKTRPQCFSWSSASAMPHTHCTSAGWDATTTRMAVPITKKLLGIDPQAYGLSHHEHPHQE